MYIGRLSPAVERNAFDGTPTSRATNHDAENTRQGNYCIFHRHHEGWVFLCSDTAESCRFFQEDTEEKLNMELWKLSPSRKKKKGAAGRDHSGMTAEESNASDNIRYVGRSWVS